MTQLEQAADRLRRWERGDPSGYDLDDKDRLTGLGLMQIEKDRIVLSKAYLAEHPEPLKLEE